LIKYLGSKRVLLPWILETIGALPDVDTVVDLFSGTSRVGYALKSLGKRVLANDHNAYAETLARCYVQSDAEEWTDTAERLIADLDALPGRPGWFTDAYCVQSRFFRPENGARVDAIRDAIAALSLAPELEAIALTSLMEAADRVDSTTGVQMAYLKDYAPRAANSLHLRVPTLLPRARAGRAEAFRMDAVAAAPALAGDLLYLDPPYNQHKYLGNYHIWESLVRWDHPELYGVARKRVDCRTRSSAFNSRTRIYDALRQIVLSTPCPRLLVSFSDEGFVSRQQMETLLSTRGRVTVLEQPHRRYVGAQIGIYNPKGEKVGKVGHLENREYLYLVTPE
jgi:adenine-specific DNA-methyltransferase